MKKPELSELTLREKIGQMGVYRSGICQEKLAQNADDLALIGGVWVIGALDLKVINMSFETTGEKISAHDNWMFVDALNKKNKIPVIACCDCLSGIKGNFYDMSNFVSPATIGAADSEELAYRVGASKAKELKCAGAKWLWGPEEDMVSRFAAISLGRKYSDDPDRTIRMAKAETLGIQDNGVAATAKHFPGEDGMEYRDPHAGCSEMRLSVDEWWKKQGRVFQEVIDAGVYSIMIGHQTFPAYDNTKLNGRYLPSTISKKVVTDLLKGEMNFNGVVITDAIEMAGLEGMFSGGANEISVACINAGCDVILGCAPDFVSAMEKAVNDGLIEESRIDDACQRILDMKEKLGMFDQPMEVMNEKEVVAETEKLNWEIAEKALSLVCDNNKILPIKPEKYKKVLIIYAGINEGVFNSLEIMKDEFLKHGVEEVRILNGLEDDEDAATIPPQYDLIVYAAHLGTHDLGYYGRKAYTFHLATTGGQMGKRIGVSLGSPHVYYDYFGFFDCFINAYNATEMTQRSFVKAIYGELPFDGIHPFKLIPEGFEVNY